MGRGKRWVVAAFCALGAGFAAAAPAAAQTGPVSFLIPVSNVSLPPSLSGGVIGGLATDASGNVYAGVDKAGVAFVAVFNPAGTFLRQWQVDGLLTLRSAIVLAVGPDGLVYVAPSGGAAGDELVRVFTAAGAPVRTFGQGSGLREVTDIEVDQAGSVYVTARARADRGLPDDMIVRFNPAGAVAARLVPAPGKAHQFGNALKGLAVGPNGSIYVTTDTLDTSFAKVVGLDPAGARIPVPDFAFVIPGDRHRFVDVDFANGNLYLAGQFVQTRGRNPYGVAVVTPQGRLLDLVIGESARLAVFREDLYATGIHGLRSPSARTVATHIDSDIGHVEHKPVSRPGQSSAYTSGPINRRNECPSPYRDEVRVWQVDLSVFGGACGSIHFQNYGSPCPPGTVEHVPLNSYANGSPIGKPQVLGGSIRNPSDLVVDVRVPATPGSAGPIIVEWACVDAQSNIEPTYEWKGYVNLVDPSGTVLDAVTGGPVSQARVRLQFSLRKGGPFGTPGISGFTPQTNPQVTGRNGAFGWDVAPGFWRLGITAFGYRPFTSPVYSVPPEVTGLKLKLRPDPRQQARLLDPYTGRAGTVRVGARIGRGTRVAGLALRAAGGRLRKVTVRAKRFRTASGVALGSSQIALREAYAREVTAAVLKARRGPSSYRIGKATFTVRRGRVVGIVLGR